MDDVIEAFLAEIDGRQMCGVVWRRHPGLSDSARRSGRTNPGVSGDEKHSDVSGLSLTGSTGRCMRPIYRMSRRKRDSHSLDIKSDARGSLAEFIKQEHIGQIFVSRTKPGVTRGNHYHHTKTEKFFVVEGDGLIRMRAIEGGPIEEYRVTGSAYQVIDIPPGFTHSITNVGAGEMVTLFWSSEMFDPDRPDTFYLPVDVEEQGKMQTLVTA